MAALAASATNPLAELLARQGNGYLCFRRLYDEAHLRRHPGQLTTSAFLSLDPGKDNTGATAWLKLQLHQKGWSSPVNVGASCEWSLTANEDTSGNRLSPGNPRDDGFACMALHGNQTAEEAGILMFDLAADGGSVSVYFHEEGIGLWGPMPEKTGASRIVSGDPFPLLKLGREDRVFRLTRAVPEACRDMEQAIDIIKD